MKGEVMYKILDFLEDKSVGAFNFFEAIISSGYGASFGKLQYENKKREEKRLNNKTEREKIRSLNKYIWKLKKDGLLLENRDGQMSLTKDGKKKLDILKKQKIINGSVYKKELSNKVTIISYDIPISFNKERNQLRDTLKVLGFNLIHKSVWIGKVKLPKEFIFDLEKLSILDYIEILEVTKSGSLKFCN